MRSRLLTIFLTFVVHSLLGQVTVPIALNIDDMSWVVNIAQNKNVKFSPNLSFLLLSDSVEAIIVDDKNAMSKFRGSTQARRENIDSADYTKIRSIVEMDFFQQGVLLRVNPSSLSTARKVALINDGLKMKRDQIQKGNKVFSILDSVVANTYQSLPESDKLSFIGNSDLQESLAASNQSMFELKQEKNLVAPVNLKEGRQLVLDAILAGNIPKKIGEAAYIVTSDKYQKYLVRPPLGVDYSTWAQALDPSAKVYDAQIEKVQNQVEIYTADK